MIEKIAIDVSKMLINSTPSRDFDDLVGMRAHMERMEELLSLDLDEVRMIGIWGPPGIGKSTIARFLFDQVFSRFQLGAIMVNVKAYYPTPCLDEYSAQLQLQNQMLSQVISHKDNMIRHLGVAQERFKDKKVFLVLDDVDRVGQLIALAKETQWFGPGSRIIITTEDVRVLKAHGIKHLYQVNLPSSDEALQIFCMHAFGKKHPDDGFHKLSWEIVALAGKLPLGLKVLGSVLRGMSKQEWKRTLQRLKIRLHGEIESIIKFSYDALDDEEKYLFLYIACLFSFQISRKVEELLAKTFADARHSLDILAKKSLISIDQSGRIEMHTLLRQFGREISRKQFIHGFVKRQLLVDAREICEVLSDNITDNRHFIGIDLDLSKTEEEINVSEKALERMSDLQFINFQGNRGSLSERLDSLLCHSQKIRSLRWTGFQNICLPSTFNLQFLVELVMPYNKLKKLWKGTQLLRNLKWMDLHGSTDLKELPDLSTATNLEELILEYCSSLVEFPSSIGKLTSLQILDLSRCSSLVELPSSIGNAIYLHKVLLKGCSSLVELPSSLMNISNLEELNLNECTSLVKLPCSIENAINLKELDLFNCSSLLEFPSIGNAVKLEELTLDNCSSLVKLPSSINATNLRKLFLKNCSRVVELPTIENATNLRILELNNCPSLLELPPIRTATNLERLDISGCSSLVKFPSSIGDTTKLEVFNLSNCSSLVELPFTIRDLQQLSVLRMCGCSKLEALPTNINLESLCILDLTNCSQLKSFPEISTNIWYLSLIGTAVKEVPLSIMSWSRLSKFHMSYFESLKEFPHALDIITEMHLVKEDIQEVAPWVKGISRLSVLRLHDCNNLVSLPQFSDSLSFIDAENCKSLERLDCSFNNPEMCLKFTNCFKLNQEARDLIMHTSTREIILPGKQVPAFFDYRATAGGSLTIKLNERHVSLSLRFKACIMVDKGKEDTSDDENSMLVEIGIMDKQKDLTVLCKRSYRHINPLLTEHIYTFEVEARDVTSTELVIELKPHKGKWKIRECGLLQILEVPSC